MEPYLWNNELLFKDYGTHVKRVSEQVKKASLAPFREQGSPVIYVPSSQTDNAELARAVVEERGIDRGLVCALSALEPSPSF